MRRSLLLLVTLLAACAHRQLSPVAEDGATNPAAPATPPAPMLQPLVAPAPVLQPLVALAPAQERPAPLVSGGAEPKPAPAPEGERRVRAARPETAPPASTAEARARLVAAARRYLGGRFRGDCSGFVRRVYADAGVALPILELGRTMSESLFRSMEQVTEPLPGDLAFFHSTRRRDRKAKDPGFLTHVAMVELVDGDRVVLIHRESKGIRRLAMNLERPHDPSENGIVRRRWARSAAPGLAGELFAGYATALRREPPAVASLVEFAPGS